MKISIINLILRNFKGIKRFDLALDGYSFDIYGDNGAGKTTLYDAFLWALFDKDSTNRKDFSIKPHDKHGQEIHGLEHEVELILSIDTPDAGRQSLKLKKQLTEKWTKKRGEADKEFTGHETAYWIDDVPVKKNEYVDRISELVDEKIFKLLTNPYYFNQQLKWDERRKLLLQICGDISDEFVILSNDRLAKLSGILAGKSIDDYGKILREQIKKLNQEIDKIPVRIDELTRPLGNNANVDYDIIETGILDFKEQLMDIERELTGSTDTGSQLREKQLKLLKIERDIEDRKRELERQANAGRNALADEKTQLEMAKARRLQEIDMLSADIKANTDKVLLLGKEMSALREKWNEEFQKVFIPPNETDFVCPTCRRPLPEDDITTRVKDLQESFEAVKKAAMERINADGKALKAKKETLEANNAKYNNDLFKAEANLQELNERLTELDSELSAELLAAGRYDSTQDAEYCRLMQERSWLKADLEKPVQEVNAGLIAKKQDLTKQIEDLQRILSERDTAERTKGRIAELKDEGRRLAGQIAELEGHKFLIEQLVKTKVNLLEESLNSRFKNVRFKLFDVQINGAVAECCETLINGVPFADANHAGQINAGIDIINTLSEHYGLSCPLWIDNAEAVNDLTKTAGQVIRLIVSRDKKLKAEVA